MANFDQWTNNGYRRQTQGDLDGAEAAYRRVLAIRPQFPRALYLLGSVLAQKNAYEQAVPILERAAALMPDHAKTFNNLGVSLKALGRREEALAAYDRSLALDPQSPQTHYNRGYLLQDLGRWDDARTAYQAALSLQPNYPDVLNNLGNIATALRDLVTAEDYYQQALVCQPNYAEASNNLGIIRQRQGRREEALDLFSWATQYKPSYAEAHSNRAGLLREFERIDEARASCERALACKPDFADAHNNLGNIFRDLGDLPAAESAFQTALRLQPTFLEARNNFALLLHELGRDAEAIAELDAALEIHPDFVEAINNKGIALTSLHRIDEARLCFARALELNPEMPSALYNMGATLQTLGEYAGVVDLYDRAIALKPDNREGHFNRAAVWLLHGDFRRGWPEYEWRMDSLLRRIPEKTRWRGGSLAGKRLLVMAEQGMGDTLQFIRFLPMLQQFNPAEVILECQHGLASLLSSCRGFDRLIERPPAGTGETIAFDLQLPLLSLPGILGVELDAIPVDIPYLRPSDDRIAAWKKQIDAKSHDGRLKIGIVWAGNPKHANDHNRSCPLTHFGPLAQTKTVRLFSLQKGAGAAQIDGSGIEIVDIAPQLTDFNDTAAAMACLDLVITVDTSVAHLAGAVGAPVWTLLPCAPDWRWLLERADSPWYPTMRLFRQASTGDWTGVFEQVTESVKSVLPRTAGWSADAPMSSRATERTPSASARIAVAEKEYAAGNKVAAKMAFEELSREHPRDIGILNRLGVVLWDLGETAPALTALCEALKIDPNDRDTVLNTSQVLAAFGAVDDARTILNGYLRQRPHDTEAIEIIAGMERVRRAA